ncbi:hypothetical protein [Streptomyces sp. MAR4 CNX-425]|uniref:hypothetical protein n=1 Tax=Streptomyces sp. MAR4 CNX-425 TaxID=3406343 RepID=UPI003B500C42
MDTKPFLAGPSENAVTIARVADRQWHAPDDDVVVALGALYRAGADAARAGVHASNRPATALFEGVGARPVGSNLELVR